MLTEGLRHGRTRSLSNWLTRTTRPSTRGTVAFDVPRHPRQARIRSGGDDRQCGSTSQSPRRTADTAASAERECERLNAGIEEVDFDGAVDDRSRLPYELIQPLIATVPPPLSSTSTP